MATLLVMGICTVLIGLLPTYAAIGIAAPILLTVLRIGQGIGVGGEWGGSVLMSMEWGTRKQRGLMASWPQMGVPLGLLLGTGVDTVAGGAGEALVFHYVRAAVDLRRGTRCAHSGGDQLRAVALLLGEPDTPVGSRASSSAR